MIDRPIRPGFPDGYKNEVHIVATTLVCDGENQPDVICVGGASAALLVGGAPFDGPAACVKIGRNAETGEFIVNPTYEEDANSDLDLTIAGTKDYISMVEAGAKEISEGHARCHDLRSGSDRRVLRQAGRVHRQGQSNPDGVQAPYPRS